MIFCNILFEKSDSSTYNNMEKNSQIKQETALLTYPMSLSLLSLPSQRRPHPFTSYRKIKQAYILYEGLLVDFGLLHGIQETGECFYDISRNM